MHFHFATRTFLRHLHPGQKQLFIFDYTIQLWNIKFLIFMISYKNCMIERKVAVRITRFGYSVSPRLSPAVRERKEAPTAVGASVFRLHVFNPPTPRGVGPGQSAQHGAGVLISIHPPREGWDLRGDVRRDLPDISIHPPLAGWDLMPCGYRSRPGEARPPPR